MEKSSWKIRWKNSEHRFNSENESKRLMPIAKSSIGKFKVHSQQLKAHEGSTFNLVCVKKDVAVCAETIKETIIVFSLELTENRRCSWYLGTGKALKDEISFLIFPWDSTMDIQAAAVFRNYNFTVLVERQIRGLSGQAILPHQQINLLPLIQKTQSPLKTPLKKNKIDNLRIGIFLTVLSCLLIFSQKKNGRPHFPSDQREQTKSKFSENWQFGKPDSKFWCLISKFGNPLKKYKHISDRQTVSTLYTVHCTSRWATIGYQNEIVVLCRWKGQD